MGRKRATVELFEEIRREYEHGVGTVKGVARKFGVHRRMVREALAEAIPRPKRKPERLSLPVDRRWKRCPVVSPKKWR